MKTTIKSAVIGLVALTAVNFASATTTPYNNATELKLVSSQKNLPIFQLQLNNTESEEVLVVITDNLGTVLHSEVLKGTFITRNFQLDLQDLNGADLTMKVYSRNSSKTVVFAITDDATSIVRLAK
ncbi:MAG: hypothetical protein ACK5DG_07095 [Chitinophagaceae bacterium]